MSSFLCFICHSTINSDTTEDIREKYREVIGIHLCPDSHLCHICCHILNKLWLFKTICLKRSMEYPVLFSEKGTINLQRNDMEIVTICPNECDLIQNRVINFSSYIINDDHKTESNPEYIDYESNYIDLHDERNNIDSDVQDVPINNFEMQENENNIQLNETDQFIDYNNQINDVNYNDNEFINDDYTYQSGTESILIDDHNNDNDLTDDLIKGIIPKKSKSKKSKKKGFERIKLSLEEQKLELEANRRDKKYVEAEFKCYNCALGFLFKDTYQTHMMRHEESNGEYRCDTCTLRFATSSVLRAHAALHAERLRCVRCERVLSVRRQREHAATCHAGEGSVECHLCGNMFRHTSGLQQHLRRYHQTKTSNRNYSCSICGKSYNNQAAVRTHMIIHIHRKFDCDQCNSSFSSPYTLNQHKKKHVTETDLHYCSTCRIGYNTRKSLLAHMRNALAHKQKVFECPVCRRVCPSSRSLQAHISAVHTRSKHLQCPACPARYSTRKALLSHMSTHKHTFSAQPPLCHVCGESFKTNSKLNRHLKEVCEKDRLEEELSAYYE